MRSIGKEGWNATAIRREADLSEKQVELREKFFSLLELWADGDIGLAEVHAMSGGGYICHQIMMTMGHNHPLWDLSQKYFEMQARRQRGDGVYTSQGYFTREEIESHEGRLIEDIDPDTNQVELYAVFPTAYMTGVDGKPDKSNPIYGRPPAKRSYEDVFARRKYGGEDDWAL